jgi:hypothetical protein
MAENSANRAVPYFLFTQLYVWGCLVVSVICRGSEKYEDESFVLPALLRFNGEPLVDDDGRLLYKFPDLQVPLGDVAVPEMAGSLQRL